MSLALWLADIGLKSTTLLLLAGLLTLGLSRRSAALRHLVWGLALGAALVLPLVSPAVPRWSPPVTLSMPGAGQPGAAQQAAAGPRSAGPSAVPASLSPSSAPGRLTATASGSPDGERPGRATWLSRLDHAWRAVAAGWAIWLVPLWAAGSALILVSLGLSLLRTARLRRWGRPARLEVQTLVQRLSGRLGLRRRVTALELDGTVMPMTFGTLRPVILLPASAAQWSADRLEDVLLHELAHVQRYDCLSQVIARCACALYWLNPLVWVAAGRLGAERELACDDLVLASGSRASDYATHLLEIARGLRLSPQGGVASIAMARPSQLAARLRALLDGSRAREALTGRLAVRGSVAALALLVPLAGARTWETRVFPAPFVSRLAHPASPTAAAAAGPEFPAALVPGVRRPGAVVPDRAAPAQGVACAWDSRDRPSSASQNVNDDQFTIRLKVGACSLRVDGEGELTFSDNDDDVTGISRGGFFHIEERGGDADRRVEIEAGSRGLERKWLVDGTERPYDAEARAWLAQRLLVVFRRTGFDAKNRAERILRRGGVEAVLQEVAQIPSDYGARRYYQVVLTQPNLDQPTLLRIVRQAGQDIGSDFELAELLIAVAAQQPLEEPVRLAYVEAVGSIGSDFERHRALKAVLTRQGISREMAAAMLATAKGIGSDFELASLLIEIVRAHTVDATLAPAFFDALASVGSAFENHRVLSAVVRQANGDPAVLDRALDAAPRIRSDFELTSFLMEVAGAYPAGQALPASFLAAAGQVRGDFEHARVLKAVVARKPLTEANLLAVLESAETIHSDFELAEVLIAAARALPPTERTRPAFLTAAEHISSEHERGRVLSAIFPRSRPA